MTQQQWGRGPYARGGGLFEQPGFGSPYGRQRPGPGFGRPQLGQPYYVPSPYGGPPPRRRRHPFRSLLLGLFGVALVAIVGLMGSNLTQPTATARYQNEDYRVPPPDRTPPPLPVPETYEEAEAFVGRNPFYRQSAPAPVRCDAAPVNVVTADDAQLKAHFESLVECLMRVWEQPVTSSGYQLVRPTVTIYGRELTTKCGKSQVNAFYCSADQQVYFSNLLPDYVPIVKRNKWAADVVMAHEFAHALQARTGILVSAHALGQNSGSRSTELQLSRRLETQSDCWSGMFLRSVADSLQIKQSDIQGIERTYYAVGDDVVSGRSGVVGNHGLARTRQYWGSTGLGTSAVGTCNTFTVRASQVR